MAGDVNISGGTLLAEKYRILDLLGEGGMGAVYLAENIDIGRQVAIKVLKRELAADPSAMARFRQEARAAAAIGHPGIVEVLDMGMLPDGGAFIVMERLEGQTLREHLAKQGSLGPGDLVEIVGSVLDTLAAAHDKGVIHRDLKPDNIFLAWRPVPSVKILDFGISKFRNTGDVALTRTGTVMGTPLYMSPEQARGSKDVSVTADIYSVGAILYESLSGQPPFPGESYNEVLAKVLMDTARPLGQLRPDVPLAMAELIELMISKDPTARPPSAREAAARLRATLPAGSAPPRGVSNTLIRTAPETPAPGATPSFKTGPKPLRQSVVEATYTPPPRSPLGISKPPPTDQVPLGATMDRPEALGAHAVTQTAPQAAKGNSKVLIGAIVALGILLTITLGVLLGQRSSPPGRTVAVPTVTVDSQGVTIKTPGGTLKIAGDEVANALDAGSPVAVAAQPPAAVAVPPAVVVPAVAAAVPAPTPPEPPQHLKPNHPPKKPKQGKINAFGGFQKAETIP